MVQTKQKINVVNEIQEYVMLFFEITFINALLIGHFKVTKNKWN